MLRNAARTLVALAAAAGLGIGFTPAVQAAPVPTANVQRAAAAPVAEPRLVDVDFDRRDGFDRITFRFRGGVPEVSARFVRVARFDDGEAARVPGRAILLLRFDPARARDFDSDLQRVDLDNVRAFRVIGDRRGVVRVALGLRERAAIRVQERSNRIILDVENRDRDRDRDRR